MKRQDAREAYNALMKFYPLTLDDIDGEEWRDIEGYDGLYQISNFGRVKSFKFKTPRIMKPLLQTTGSLYLAINLYSKGKIKRNNTHRIVAQTFVPNPENKPEVNHIDGHTLNNHVSNLEWATRSENEQHAYNMGLAKQGEAHGLAKLTNEQVRYIRDNPDNFTGKKLAQMFGVCETTISHAQLGKKYKIVGGTIREAKNVRLPADVRAEIRKLYVRRSKEFSSPALAKKFNVDKMTILRIVKEGD